jgi:hypothetical protein
MGRALSLVAVLFFSSTGAVLAQVNPFTPGGTATPRPPSLPGQPLRDNAAPQTGTAMLAGRAVAAPGTSPLRRVQIQLTSADGQQRRSTTTDGEGRYKFEQLPAGRYTLTATKGGYVTLQYGQRYPFEPGTPVTLTDKQTLEKVDFSLPRGSVIAARITDEFGEPLTGVMVQVQRYQYGPDGQRKLTAVQGAPAPFSGTDDRGEFRLYGLMPGEYVVQASMRSLGGPMAATSGDSSEGYSPTFFPGALTADQAQPISLGVGEEQTIQFAMMAGRLGRVSGIVVDAESRPIAGASLQLVTVTGTGMSSSPAGQSAANGMFTVNGISPGDHTLQASLRATGGTPLSGSLPISVAGEDLTGVTISLGFGAVLSGRVTFDGTAPRTGGATPVRVNVQRVDQQALAFMSAGYDPLANGEVDENGLFKLGGASGRVFIGVNTPPGWAIRSVSAGGENVTDVPLDLTNGMTLSDVRIVLTDKVTSVSGTVKANRDREQKDYVVVVLPAGKLEPLVAARMIRVGRPDTQGRFELTALRPGSYVAAAVDVLEQGRQFSPEFQEKLRSRAREFSLREGQSVTVDLDLVTGL